MGGRRAACGQLPQTVRKSLKKKSNKLLGSIKYINATTCPPSFPSLLPAHLLDSPLLNYVRATF